jgi:hypothetical protein
MRAQSTPRYPRSRSRQRGQAFIFIAILLGMGLLALAIGATTSASNSIANQQTKDVELELARVKDALIGWSASRTPTGANPNARPGELPCPDTDNNGYAENDDDNNGIDEANCIAGAIGRVPWRTLGIPEPKDSAGETLWYAISGNFRVYRSAAPNIYTAPITSDTLGTLTVYRDSTANTITSQAVAVIFAPGPAVGTQDRSTTTTMSCTAPSGTYFRNQCASNYLEIFGGVNNATNTGTFIRGPSSSTFNDRLLVITSADLMPLVEQRVAREMRSLLQAYKAATATTPLYIGGVYPWADWGDGNSNDGENRGRFPCGNATPIDWNSPVPLSLSGATTPALPNWLANGCGTNGWPRVIYYTAGRSGLDILNVLCVACSGPTLNVNGSAGFEVVLLTPGAASTDPRGTWTNNPGDNIVGYFEDGQNSDNNNDSYVTPTSTAYDRDRIFTIP